jgi:PAS domain S-box-containing protein
VPENLQKGNAKTQVVIMSEKPAYEELERRVQELEKSSFEMKQREEVLRARNRFLSMILQSSAQGFWLLDVHGVIIDVNEAYCSASGYSRGEVLGLHISDIDVEELPDETRKRIRRIIANGSELFEAHHRRKDGSVFTLEISMTYLDDDGGRLVCFSRDLTERRRVEKELAHSRDLMRYIIEHANSAVAVHDRDLRYIYVSQRYLEVYNVSERDVIGKHHYEVFPDLPQKWREVHQKALSGEVSSAERDPYLRENGTLAWTRGGNAAPGTGPTALSRELSFIPK